MGGWLPRVWFVGLLLVGFSSEAGAQAHFTSSIDRSVAAVGESFLLTLELIASPDSDAERDSIRAALARLELEVPADDVTIVRSLRPRMTQSSLLEQTVAIATRKFILKAGRPGRVEIPPINLDLPSGRMTAGSHDLMAYSLQRPFTTAKRAVLPLVVESKIGDDGLRRFIGYGSSFLIAEDALVTAYHVIVNAEKVLTTLPNGKQLSIKKIWAVDPLRDIAVLHVDPDEVKKAGLTPLEVAPRDFENGRNALSGEPEIVFTAGWPQGVQRSQAGVLFAVNNYYDDEAIWLSSNYVRPGDSGGPLLDESGQVIGVISYAMSGRRTATQLLENVATSTDPRPALAKRLLLEKPEGLGRYRKREFFERNPHAMAAKVASLLTEFSDPRGRAALGSIDPFLRQLDDAVTMHFTEARLHFLQGSVYQMLGAYTDAKSAYQRALVMSSDHYPAAYSLAYCQLATRSYADAAKLFTFISEFEPYENLAKYGLAQAEMQLLHYENAVDLATDVIHDHPDFAPALYLLGRAFLGLGENVSAVQMLAKLQTVDKRWASLLGRTMTIAPFRPVERYSMPRVDVRVIE